MLKAIRRLLKGTQQLADHGPFYRDIPDHVRIVMCKNSSIRKYLNADINKLNLRIRRCHQDINEQYNTTLDPGDCIIRSRSNEIRALRDRIELRRAIAAQNLR